MSRGTFHDRDCRVDSRHIAGDIERALSMQNFPTQVSVVIPTWNREKLVVEALQSARRQSLRPLEIVVVDDGSTDDTECVVTHWKAEHADSALTVRFFSQKNQGANAARNRGILEAAGKYVAFLDSDDRWLPDKLKKQVSVLEKDELVGGVYCGLRTVDLDSGELAPPVIRPYPCGNLLSQMLVHDVSSPTSCWMVRRSCFEKVGVFDCSLQARQDWDMWIRLSSKYDIGCVPEVLVEMGEHMGERVRSNPNREIGAHRAIFEKYAYLRAQCPFWLGLRARSAMYRRLGRVYLHRKGSRSIAARLQLLAILVWPFNFDSYAALVGTLMPAVCRWKLHVLWNRVFGRTGLGIRSH